MVLRIKPILILILMMNIGTVVYCQDDSPIRLTTSLGYAKYLGDLVPTNQYFTFNQAHFAFSFGGTYDLGEKTRVRMNFSLMSVSGDDKYSDRWDYRTRNLNFKTNIWEISPMFEYDFLSRNNFNLIPYIFTGFSVYHFNPTTIDSLGNKVYLHDVGTEGQYLPDSVKQALGNISAPYKRTQINIPLGLGLRYEVSENFSVGLEFVTRYLFTDYLDDVSRPNYVDPAIFRKYGQYKAAELGYRVDMSQNPPNEPQYNPLWSRGDPKYKDLYFTFQISLSFKLNTGGFESPYGGYRRAYRY